MNIRTYFKKLNLNKIIIIAGVTAGAFLIAFLFWWLGGATIIGIKNEDNRPRASLTGLVCDNYDRRPIAVMMASDPVARPLSGISQADIVIEMPVTPNGITRMMAVFQCEVPEEIGSIRSAREDFLPLVNGFGALYAHWGGEREALNKLNNGILDNIDAMKYEGTIFYRKSSIPRPHNGFTTIELIEEKAEELGYSLDTTCPLDTACQATFAGYLRTEDPVRGKTSAEGGSSADHAFQAGRTSNGTERSLSNIVETISIGYESPYDVKWVYDDNSDSYKRIRGGEAEIDRNTGEQVETSVVVVMRTTSRVLNIDYITVNTVGEGEAEFYQNGIRISGTWKDGTGNLRFYDPEGQEMKFIPGKMWIEIVTD